MIKVVGITTERKGDVKHVSYYNTRKQAEKAISVIKEYFTSNVKIEE